MIRIILAEDHTIVRKGILMVLGNQKDFKVVGEADSGKGVLALIARGVKADIIITDLEMPEVDGLELLKAVRQLKTPIHVMMFSMHGTKEHVFQSFKDGASAYLLKTIRPHELVFAIKHVMAGNRYMCTGLTAKLIERYSSYIVPKPEHTPEALDLSKKEIQILHLIADGLINEEISEKLCISKRAVEVNRDSLIRKTGTKNTASLIKFALLNGLIMQEIFYEE